MEKNMLAIAIKPTQKMLETKDNGRKGGKGTFPVYRYILFMHIKKKHSYSTTGHNATPLSWNLNTV